MKSFSIKPQLSLLFILTIVCASQAFALEIITRQDVIQGIILKTDLMKTADNAIILFDASSSMAAQYKQTGKSRYDIAKSVLAERNSYFPDLGHNFGLYLYTPWKTVYPMQRFDRNKFQAALESLPEKPTGATLLVEGMSRLDTILKSLEGRTAVFIFTDGLYTKGGGGVAKRPATIAAELAKKYDICFYLISTADDRHSVNLFKQAENFNFCSRVIAFQDFIEHPVYNSEALFTVKATKQIVTISDKKIVGAKPKDILFEFDKSALSPSDESRLDLLATYLNSNPGSYAVLAGHTDSIGTEDYNMALSRRRVEQVTDYLVNQKKVNPYRLVMFWFGKTNPVADNSTQEGRAQNRRVEILVGVK